MDDVIQLNSKLVSLELQLKVLQAEISLALNSHGAEPPPPFSSLEGLWNGQGNFSFEEIQDAELKPPPDL